MQYPPHTDRSAASAPADGEGARHGPAARGLRGWALRLPLFWKIVLANAVLVGVGGVVGVGVTQVSSGTLTAVALQGGALVILVGILVNAVLVRLALSPLEELEETARRVGEGEVEARATDSPLADQGLHRVTEVFNEMLDSLSRNRSRQQELARRVLESEERERQRIAHELYSGTAQTLAGVLVRLRVAERQLGTDAINGAVREIREEVVSALEGIRGVARRLRPPELDELGVRAALMAHARSMSAGSSLDVSFEGDVPTLDRDASLALFRIVQEAISNVVLHAGAEHLNVRFVDEDGSVAAEVEDDGCGFDLAEALAKASPSLGLFGMHERAGYVEGELSVESGPERGTRVRVVIPTHTSRPSRSNGGTVDRLVDGLMGDNGELPATAGQASRGPAGSL